MLSLVRPCAALAAAASGLFGLLAPLTTASAGVVFSGSGMSAAGNPIAAMAELSIAGDVLTVRLQNLSPVPSSAAADILSSFAFDVVATGGRPTLGYESGLGLVWQVRRDAADVPINYTPPVLPGGPGSYVPATGGTAHVPSDLAATKKGDRTWQFRPFAAGLPPLLGFGIGTVGNSGFDPNGFDPAVVGPPGNGLIAFGISTAGDIEPAGSPMQDQYLVRSEAVFRFSGLKGFTEADIGPDVVFGFGTGPDSVISLPDPPGWRILGSGLAAAALLRVRRRAGRPEARGTGSSLPAGMSIS